MANGLAAPGWPGWPYWLDAYPDHHPAAEEP